MDSDSVTAVKVLGIEILLVSDRVSVSVGDRDIVSE